MSRRDLSMVHAGPKINYDTWPHTRTALTNLRDLAITEQQLDNVAKIADQFDAEDEAWIAAGLTLRRIQGDAFRGVPVESEGGDHD